jgi:putative serine protease PepD
MVREVTAGGAAQAAGIKAGDVITAIGDTQVDTSEGLIAAVRSHRPGDEVQITYERGGSRHTVTVTLADSTASSG